MINAILYTSNTGFTAKYAAILSEKTGLSAYPLKEAAKKIPDGSEIIYMGWLMAGKVSGLKKAMKKYRVKAVAGVGMGGTGTQIDDVKKANLLPENLPVFTLRGGFDLTKLHGIYKFMMSTVKNTMGKKLAEKPDKTPDEEKMLDLLENGGDCVSEENLSEILEWYKHL